VFPAAGGGAAGLSVGALEFSLTAAASGVAGPEGLNLSGAELSGGLVIGSSYSAATTGDGVAGDAVAAAATFVGGCGRELIGKAPEVCAGERVAGAAGTVEGMVAGDDATAPLEGASVCGAPGGGTVVVADCVFRFITDTSGRGSGLLDFTPGGAANDGLVAAAGAGLMTGT